MFTVIIAEKEYLQKIEEYKLFLKPFLSSPDLVMCEWDTDKKGISEMVPALAKKVGRRKDWRAIIICDEKGIEQQNPFDLVDYQIERYNGPIHAQVGDGNESDISPEYRDYLEREHQKKLQAYEQAAQNPLTRLVTFFCDAPSVTKENHAEFIKNDPGYVRYIAENKRKQTLRARIISDEVVETMQPTEIYCIAKRTYHSAAEEFETVWSSHTELEYSRFYDRNMYFDKMRYMVFDILPKVQQGYEFDYIRFLYATLLLGSKDIPSGSLAHERVYRLECENDEAALCRLLQSYEYKMDVTKDDLLQKIKDIRGKKPRTLSDKDVQQIFSAKPVVPAKVESDFDPNSLYADYSQFGLANGCPQDEAITWDGQYKKSQKSLNKLLKLSRRAMKQVVRESRDIQEDLNDALLLNEYQIEDVQERINTQEMEMLRTSLTNLYDEKAFLNELDKENKKICNKIEERMYRNSTIIIGLLSALAFLLGFVTLFYSNAESTAFNFASNLTITGLSLGTFLVAAVIVLFFLRRALVSKLKDYNNEMSDISNRVSGAVAQYSKYLTHMNNVRCGYAVLDAIERRHSPDVGKTILYKKHIGDIEAAKENVRRVFGQFMEENVPFDKSNILPYDFNYDRPTDYVYPVPYSAETSCTITFIHTGTQTNVPVDFVKSLVVRREELYE